MANFGVEIPDNQVSRVIEGLAEAYGYTDQVTDPGTGELVNNPQTKEDFAKQAVINFIRNAVATVEANRASEAARQKAVDSVHNSLDIT
jgi:hypothetical protein